MITFPHAKINLGLQVLAKRQDGYHDIATCFYPVGWCDALEIIPSDRVEFTSSGMDIPGDPADNLCMKAYERLRTTYSLPPVRIHLHKVIPMGAGLGGGSSDAARTLVMLNELFSLGLERLYLAHLAGVLGSDCPFFVQDSPMLASGTGTDLHPVEISLAGKFIRIIYPGIPVSTAMAYARVTPRVPAKSLVNILEAQGDWKQDLRNDFEASVLPEIPVIRSVIDTLYQQGAFYAAMSGSGSAVFGLYNSLPPVHNFPEDYLTWTGPLD